MCLVARHLEALGLPTLCLGSALDIFQAGRPPRAVFVDYPLGHSSGKPFDADDQTRILRQALVAFESIETPETILHLEARWAEDEAWKAAAGDAGAGDQRQPRDTTPRYQSEDDRRLAEAALAAAS